MANIKKDILSIPNYIPIADKDGKLTQSWLMWFNYLYKRVGESDASSNADLNDKVNQNTDDIDALDIRVTATENDVNSLESRVTASENNIDTNTTDIDNLETDIDNLETEVDNNTTSINNLNLNTVQSIANVGTTIGIFRDKTGNTANFKSLKAGTNITLDNTTNTDEIVINASGGGSSTLTSFGELTITGSLIGSGNPGTLFSVKGGYGWQTAKEVNNTTKVSVANFTSTSAFGYLQPNSFYFIYFDVYLQQIKASNTPTSFSLTSNAKLLWIIQTDATKILEAKDYRQMHIWIHPLTEMKITQLYAGPRTDALNFAIYTYQNQIADGSLSNSLSSVFARFMRVNTTLLCLSADLGYAAGEEADYTTGDGTIWGKPFQIKNNGNINIYQGSQTKIWQESTNSWQSPTVAKWAIVCRVTLEYV